MEKYYETGTVINVLPTHAYFIPFEKKENVFNARETSARFQTLNGEWAVEEYPTIFDVAAH